MNILRTTLIIFICTFFINTATNAENLKRFEVDGVAVGDKLDDVLKKWGVPRSSVKIEKYGKNTSYGKLRIKINDINIRKKFRAEWDKLALKKISLQHEIEGKVNYKATFSHDEVLLSFIVRKMYNKIDVGKAYEKIKAKYGVSPRLDKEYSQYSPEEWKEVGLREIKLAELSSEFGGLSVIKYTSWFPSFTGDFLDFKSGSIKYSTEDVEGIKKSQIMLLKRLEKEEDKVKPDEISL